jgi:hypothetical protein
MLDIVPRRSDMPAVVGVRVGPLYLYQRVKSPGIIMKFLIFPVYYAVILPFYFAWWFIRALWQTLVITWVILKALAIMIDKARERRMRKSPWTTETDTLSGPRDWTPVA